MTTMTTSKELADSKHRKERWIPFAFIIVGIINGLVQNYALIPVAIGSGVVAYVYPYLNQRGWRGSGKMAYLGLLGMLCFALLNSFVRPAQAQFLGNAETFFETSFGGAIPAVDLIFNVLRGIYILYLAISLVNIFNSIRDDENWVAAAKTPLLVVLGVTVTDILTTFITGTGGTGG